jgi:excisionase family DNA binding protein
MSTAEQSRSLLTTRQVADRLGLSMPQVRRLYGDLGAFHIGRLVRFDPERVDAYLAARMAEADERRAARAS